MTTPLGQFGLVLVKGAWVTVKIFPWTKLQSIHKDTGNHNISDCMGAVNQLQVTFM